MIRIVGDNNERLSKHLFQVFEILIVVSVTPALAYGVWVLNDLPIA